MVWLLFPYRADVVYKMSPVGNVSVDQLGEFNMTYCNTVMVE